MDLSHDPGSTYPPRDLNFLINDYRWNYPPKGSVKAQDMQAPSAINEQERSDSNKGCVTGADIANQKTKGADSADQETKFGSSTNQETKDGDSPNQETKLDSSTGRALGDSNSSRVRTLTDKDAYIKMAEDPYVPFF